jgi:hypothetical protein
MKFLLGLSVLVGVIGSFSNGARNQAKRDRRVLESLRTVMEVSRSEAPARKTD